ncbi:MAG: valine--tRNA ligase [Candidatus Saganbacteria bacterium]|nr:valine--tRNA ligase [Candidatus Saganbacteria bacterium]
MTQEMPKNYNPAEVEQKWYKFWEENGLFKPDQKSKADPFTIVIPPPNVTGQLHMGHALDNSLQDVLIRYKRMQGFNTLWIPGTDHAGIATQNVVEKALRKEGKTKDDLGREKFVEKVWEWKKEYGGKITQQLRRLGASCDWSRERFTMDEGLSKAVRREFVQLYKEGLIYRGKRIINWCPRCGTALSDIEVEHTPKKGKLWHIKYSTNPHPLSLSHRERDVPKGQGEGPISITVATTRPETMLGDTAVAVNPKDTRYKHLHGKSITLPLVGRKIPIITDDFVDPEFGTGAVKVTPAHDPNDYMMGERHNLPKINILTPDAKITFEEFESAEREKVKAISGLDRFKAREKIVEMLEEGGHLEKIEDYENSIGTCYRCKQVVEPYLSDQWYVKIKPLAEVAIKAVEDGLIKFVPERWTKVYLQWMTNLRDWCISRQLWWGHQIPVWYCECNEIIVSEEVPKKCPKCGGTKLVQDPDVFDTWFSSALWPFSTLGWPDETQDLKTYYPTSVLVTGYDIITFWVSRMIMTGMHFMKKEPFGTVFIHGLVKDKSGKKMSKSTGNVIDPLEIIDKDGADTLRFTLLSLVVGQGQDMKLTDDRVREAKSFVTKLWNVSRFAQMTNDKCQMSNKSPIPKSKYDKWIISRYNKTVAEVTALIDNFEVGEAARKLYSFVWHDYCDWYVEFSKQNPNPQILSEVLGGILKLLHPFMPFITEEIYFRVKGQGARVKKNDSIMIQEWPKADEQLIDDKAEKEIEELKEVISALRRIRAEYSIPYSKEIKAIIVSKNKFDQETIKKFVKTSEISIISKLEEKVKQVATEVTSSAQVHVPLTGVIDFEKEKARLNKEKESLETNLQRVEQRLSNKKFTDKAPKEAIEDARAQKREFAEKIKIIAARIKSL